MAPLVVSELSWVRGVPCHFNVDLLADVHPFPQPEVHAIGAVNDVLKVLCGDSFADLPDAEGRAFRPNRAERMVVDPSFEVFGDGLIPAVACNEEGATDWELLRLSNGP